MKTKVKRHKRKMYITADKGGRVYFNHWRAGNTPAVVMLSQMYPKQFKGYVRRSTNA